MMDEDGELVKMGIRNANRAIAGLAIVVGVLLLAPLVSSLPTGIGGSSIQTAGCNCHNGLADGSVVADIRVFRISTTPLRLTHLASRLQAGLPK